MPLTVLVIDDSPTIAALLETALELEGHQVRVVDHRFAELLNEHHRAWRDIDVVMSDVMLGEDVTGVDLLRFAREHFPGVRRVALTAAGSPLYEQAGEAADACLPKPADIDAILRAVSPR